MESEKVSDLVEEVVDKKAPVLKSIPTEAYPRLCVSYITAFSPEEDAGSYEAQ